MDNGHSTRTGILFWSSWCQCFTSRKLVSYYILTINPHFNCRFSLLSQYVCQWLYADDGCSGFEGDFYEANKEHSWAMTWWMFACNISTAITTALFSLNKLNDVDQLAFAQKNCSVAQHGKNMSLNAAMTNLWKPIAAIVALYTFFILSCQDCKLSISLSRDSKVIFSWWQGYFLKKTR